jgi:hypothetical protein
MAITQFKEVVDKKGYKVDSKDRAIFEQEVAKSYFGLGTADTIEFVLYDISDNILPQGESGDKVRYIFLDDVNIKKYFIFSENKSNIKTNGAKEYIIDTEKLVRDAGYSNGIFKTQTTLLNRRAGSETIDKDKLWIHEISPSRTEIRILPLKDKDGNIITDLSARINIFLNDGEFRDDTIYFIEPFIESLKVETILQKFVSQKGTILQGETYTKLIQKEFNIPNWEEFISTIKNKLVESTKYYIQNRDSSIKSINYGKPLSTPRQVELSILQIKQSILQSLVEIIEYYLPKRNIQEDNILSKDEQITLDATKEILKSILGSTQFISTEIGNKQAIVRGCTDRNALNYNPLAVENDGSCVYQKPSDNPIPKIKGCMDPNSLNYNPAAQEDDGSCRYADKPQVTTKTFYVWSENGGITFIDKDGNKNTNVFGREYESFTITYQGSPEFSGDVREIPKQRVELKLFSYTIYNGSHEANKNINYNGSGFGSGFTNSFQYKNSAGEPATGPSLEPGKSVTICAAEGTVGVGGPNWTVTKNGDCGTPTNYQPTVSYGNPSGGGTSGGGGGGVLPNDPNNRYSSGFGAAQDVSVNNMT